MKSAVTTLPISPVTEPHVGLCVIPLLADLIGDSLGMEKILALNIQGLKYDLASPQSEKLKIAQSYLTSMARLEINPDYIWRDDLNEFAIFAQTALTELLNRKLLTIKRVPVARCECGKVEYIEGTPNFSIRRRLFDDVGGKRVCKLCRGALQIHETEVCLFTISSVEKKFFAIPKFAEVEFRMLARSFIGVEYLVSRSRVTHFSLNLPGLRDFDIDPDFLWSLMLSYLYTQGYNVKFLIGSRKNMLACFFIGTLAQTFDCEDPIFVFPPYLVGPKRINVKTFGAVDRMISSFGSDVVRAFLLHGLNWRKAEAVINPALLNHFSSLDKNFLRKACDSIMPKTSKEITKMSGINLTNAMARVIRQEKKGRSQ
jgi:hypothetical protein